MYVCIRSSHLSFARSRASECALWLDTTVLVEIEFNILLLALLFHV